jgi:hypothetical protein
MWGSSVHFVLLQQSNFRLSNLNRDLFLTVLEAGKAKVKGPIPGEGLLALSHYGKTHHRSRRGGGGNWIHPFTRNSTLQ